MKITCRGQWQEALEYFLDETVQAKMKGLGLVIDRMDWRTETVYLKCVGDEELYCKQLAAIESSGTRCNELLIP